MTTALPRCNECAVRSISLCGTLFDAAPDQYESLKRSFQTVASKRIIWRAGTVPNTLLILRGGWAFSYSILNDGRRQIYNFFVPGDPIGMYVDGRKPLPYSVQALTRVELCGFNLDDVIPEGLKHNAFRVNLRENYWEYVRMLEDRLIYVSRYPASSRIASLILHLRDRMAQNGFLKGDVMEFPMTQSHVADALGLTTAHVNRMFAELRNDGILTFGSGQLTIHDSARLAELVKSSGG